jgi:hypothetical protein
VVSATRNALAGDGDERGRAMGAEEKVDTGVKRSFEDTPQGAAWRRNVDAVYVANIDDDRGATPLRVVIEIGEEYLVPLSATQAVELGARLIELAGRLGPDDANAEKR